MSNEHVFCFDKLPDRFSRCSEVVVAAVEQLSSDAGVFRLVVDHFRARLDEHVHDDLFVFVHQRHPRQFLPLSRSKNSVTRVPSNLLVQAKSHRYAKNLNLAIRLILLSIF